MSSDAIFSQAGAPRVKAALVSSDEALREAFLTAYPREEVDWTLFKTGEEAAGSLLSNPPELLVCSAVLPDMLGIEMAKMFKSENVYSQVPVILCVDDEYMLQPHDWATIEIDDFLVFPCTPQTLHARVELVKARTERTWDANPLTHLPGNTSIIRRTQGLIDQRQDFALGYCDLDFFKPFNDKYGFARGDEILMMTARLLVNSIRALALPFSFVGHVGGDDYVFIVPIEAAEQACQSIIQAFDGLVPYFYDEKDRQRGEIVSTDRQGELRTFPLMGISIAVVLNRNGNLSHYGEASQIAMNLKKIAKESPKSAYVFDRRR